MTDPGAVAVVVPTLGRPSLAALLAALGGGPGPHPAEVLIVDDRPGSPPPLTSDVPAPLAEAVRVIRGAGRGPAAARNLGWRATSADWVAFLDDDVLPPPGWFGGLLADLGASAETVAGSQGGIVVPLPAGRRPTDWERTTAGLATARWATADMAYRRTALSAVGGFDERFPRAFREDADLALRVLAAGYRLSRGERHVVHPVRPVGRWVSLCTQAGNADDPLMRRVHGRDWRQRAGTPRGRRRRHLAITAAGVLAVGAAAAGRRRPGMAAASAWAAGTAEFAAARVLPGPRTAAEVLVMVGSSVAIPPLAAYHWLRGCWRHRAAGAWSAPLHQQHRVPAAGVRPPAAVLFDRDGTLVHDVPYNGDPDRVRPVATASRALARLRAAGVRTGVVTNQSGVARGLITPAQVTRVNERIDALLGPFDVWAVCPHGPADGCGCRKPAPGLVTSAARELGVDPSRVTVIGDVAGDVEAAAAAGAGAILVPTPVTRAEEVSRAGVVARDLDEAVDLLLGTG